MSERRFSEEEVAEILKHAAESQHAQTNVLPSATGLTLAMFIVAAVGGSLADRGFLAAVTTLAVGGVAMFGAGALGLPRWARVRQQQMDAIAERVESSQQG